MKPSECAQARDEHGAIGIMFAAALPIICAFCMLALDLSQVYNRKMELQSVADTVALAAALELDGTAAGVGRAMLRGTERFTASAPSALTYRYGNNRMDWSDSAIQFGTSSKGPWLASDVAAAKASPNGLLFVKVDSAGLTASYGRVSTIFAPVLSRDLASISTAAHAVAGRVGIAVTPLAVCAMRAGANAKRNRNGELEEYGFRRGVSYDLMQLNPNGTDVGKTFLINPLAAPGAAAAPTSDFNTIAPFICTGTMAVERVLGGTVSISAPFPIGDYFNQLNSRFDSYTAPCIPDSAPPDTNIKSYTFNDGSVAWMTTAPTSQAAALSLGDGKRWTVAGPDPTPAGTTGVQFGPLWSYAKAVKYADPAPSSGYSAYGTADWATLYTPGQPRATSYPSTTPYLSSTRSPSRKGLSGRRVLNVPLLACPVSGSTANILGIGKFFMTVAADKDHLYTEFAGMADEQTLRVQVKLYP